MRIDALRIIMETIDRIAKLFSSCQKKERAAFVGYVCACDPEALYFYRRHKCPTFTFETPSEFDLNLRIKAQSAMIQRAVTSIQE